MLLMCNVPIIINLTFYMSFFLSSSEHKQLHSLLCACLCSLNIKKTLPKTVKLIMIGTYFLKLWIDKHELAG